MSNPVVIEAQVDIEALREAIEKAGKLEDDQAVFEALASVESVKRRLQDAVDSIATIEAEAKRAISAKAVSLYGPDWTAIKGERFKITRSATGPVFSIAGKASKKFLKVVETVDAKAVEAYVKESGKLPAGIEYNGNRGSSIRITVVDHEDGQA